MMHDDFEDAKDLHIVHRVLDGDVNAFELLLRKYKNDIFRIVRKHVPPSELHETAHEVFVRAYQSLATFEARSGFQHWLWSIAVRTCYDYWRRRYRRQEVPISSLSDSHLGWLARVMSDRSMDSFCEHSAQEETREVLDWALAQLSPEDRIVLELVYLEGLSGKEAAQILGWSVANVKVRSFRSRRKLRNMLTGFIERCDGS
jgi:RNA polymerase sigma-70 factor (ECF subfamily)